MTSDAVAAQRTSAASLPARLRVDIARLRNQVGTVKEVSRRIAIEPATVLGVELDDVIDVDVEVERTVAGFQVTGRVVGTWTSECRRCCDPVSGEVEAELDEEFRDRGRVPRAGRHADVVNAAAASPGDGEIVNWVEDESIELSGVARDAVLGNLIAAPLCREDCPGPADEVYPIVVGGSEAAGSITTAAATAADADAIPDGTGEVDRSTPARTDDRWAALEGLRLDE